MSLLKWLGIAEENETQVNSLGEIERALTELIRRPRRDTSPAFAYILHRIARADHEISDAESALIEQLVATRGGLAPGTRPARRENRPDREPPPRRHRGLHRHP